VTDLIDGSTGELRRPGAEVAVMEMLGVPAGLYGTPLGSHEMDEKILELDELLAHARVVVTLLYEDRHRAEEKYEAAFSDYMVMHEKSGAQLARQYATAKTKTERHELNIAKEKLRYAEEMLQSLQNRSFALMNINKKYTGGSGMGGAR
jgi:hypothetical protein